MQQFPCPDGCYGAEFCVHEIVINGREINADADTHRVCSGLKFHFGCMFYLIWHGKSACDSTLTLKGVMLGGALCKNAYVFLLASQHWIMLGAGAMQTCS